MAKTKNSKERETQRLKNAQTMTNWMLSQGYDGLIYIRSNGGELEIVDYRVISQNP